VSSFLVLLLFLRESVDFIIDPAKRKSARGAQALFIVLFLWESTISTVHLE